MWRSLNITSSGLLAVMNEIAVRAQERPERPQHFPDLRKFEQLRLASDYSGDQRGAKYRSYSFLLTSHESWAAWETERLRLRDRFHLEGRRMRYSRLSDTRRAEVLPHFLAAAGALHGLSVTVLVNHSVAYPFGGPIDPSKFPTLRYKDWKPATLERLIRVVSLAAFVVGGMSDHRQHVDWVTDEDPIAATDVQVDDLKKTLAGALSRVMRDPPSFDFQITAGDLELEDLASIPDLIAGVLSELLREYESEGVELNSDLSAPPRNLSDRAKLLMDWFSNPDLALQRFVLFVDPAPGRDDGVFKVTELGLQHGQPQT